VGLAAASHADGSTKVRTVVRSFVCDDARCATDAELFARALATQATQRRDSVTD